jgi:hypothetical protein
MKKVNPGHWAGFGPRPTHVGLPRLTVHPTWSIRAANTAAQLHHGSGPTPAQAASTDFATRQPTRSPRFRCARACGTVAETLAERGADGGGKFSPAKVAFMAVEVATRVGGVLQRGKEVEALAKLL